MTEMLCQMCGKPNPEGQEICQHCGARLIPLDGSAAAEPSAEEERPTPPSPPQAEPPAPGQEPGAEGEDLSWLDDLRQEEQEESPPATPDREEEEKPETDWLERIKRLDGEEEEAAPAEEDEGAFPSWMTEELRAQAAPPGPGEDQQEEKKEEENEELPQWLQIETDELGIEPPPPEEKTAQSLLDREITPRPGAEESREQPREGEPEESQEEEGEQPEAPPEPAPERESKFPSWASEEEAPSPDSERHPEEEIPEDLQFLAGVEPGEDSGPETVDPFQIEPEEEDLEDLFDEELPSWLTSAVEEDFESEPAEDISPGDLPGWVEAMRPVVESTDTSGLSDDEEYIENYGPLAGISSILPAEPDIEKASPEKTPQSSLDLSVSKAQREYAELLQKVIARESKVKPAQKPVPAATQRILRWLITIILLITLSGAIIFGGSADLPAGGLPPQRTEGYAALHELILSLDAQDPVLLAFDYQPALAGEINYTASSVVDDLLEQQVYLSLVSTQATGPALAEHFLETTQAEHDYVHGQDYINLGYIPGGAAGLLSFTIAPPQIVPLAFNGSNAWDSPPLQDVTLLNDFSLILVITDDPTDAKIWVEQVETNTTTQLAMIVSAQAEPLIRPYFETSPQQIDGYVAGIFGGYAYERLTAETGLANQSWLPFNLGIVVTAGTIFIGGLANGILVLYKEQQAKNKKGES